MCRGCVGFVDDVSNAKVLQPKIVLAAIVESTRIDEALKSDAVVKDRSVDAKVGMHRM
jgi:hypothetical protein